MAHATTVHDILQAQRERVGLTIVELAARCSERGLRAVQASWFCWQRGRTKPSVEQLLVVLDVLGAPPSVRRAAFAARLGVPEAVLAATVGLDVPVVEVTRPRGARPFELLDRGDGVGAAALHAGSVAHLS